MSDLEDYIQRVFIDPTDPVTLAQDDPEALKVEIHQPAAKETFEVIQGNPTNLAAYVFQAGIARLVTNATAANLKAEIHQPAAKETFEVIQDTPADLKATVTQAAKDRTVTNPTAADLKAEVTPEAAAQFTTIPKIPSSATQLATSVTTNNDTDTIHEVNDGKTLYLISCAISLDNSSDTADTGLLFVTNADDLTQYNIFRSKCQPAQGYLGSLSFPIPLQIPAGYKVKCYSGFLNLFVNSFIFGYEL